MCQHSVCMMKFSDNNETIIFFLFARETACSYEGVVLNTNELGTIISSHKGSHGLCFILRLKNNVKYTSQILKKHSKLRAIRRKVALEVYSRFISPICMIFRGSGRCDAIFTSVLFLVLIEG